MKIDFKRLALVLIGFYIVQLVLANVLIKLGMNGLTLIVIYNLLLAFIATLIYYPRDKRNVFYKDGEFYKNFGIFFAVFLLISII